MQGQFIQHSKSSVHYRVFGKGPKLLFCFHGYGRDSYTFGFLEKVLGNKYTIIALDAPFHGDTKWDDPEFRPDDLITVINEIRKGMTNTPGKISLLGFSMGGRIALHLTQKIPEQIERVVLLAPDGLKYKSWLWFCTHTWIGHRLFTFTISHPHWLLNIVNFGEKRGLLSRNIKGFVQYYLEDEDERISLLSRWTIMRKFRPHLSSLKTTIRKSNLKVRMLFGSFDRVIHYASGQRFLRKIESYASVKIIDAGHTKSE